MVELCTGRYYSSLCADKQACLQIPCTLRVTHMFGILFNTNKTELRRIGTAGFDWWLFAS